MTPTLKWLYKKDYLSGLDYYFACFMGRLAHEMDPLVLLAAALVSRYTAHSHVCLNVARLADTPVESWDGTRFPGMTWPEKKQWLSSIAGSPLVNKADNKDARAPLVIDDGGRLYLTRYWRYQHRLAHGLKQKAIPGNDVAEALLEEGLNRLFPVSINQTVPEKQRLAVEMSMHYNLAVISGGPGTGKTSIVSKILALMMEQAVARGTKPPRIALAAPTGKAAVRLREAIIKARDATGPAGLNCTNAIKALIPKEVFTIHRILGVRRDDSTRFRYNGKNPLPVDVLIVDESSMVDLALMAKLVEAIPAPAGLILLGDKDQLASVEAGAVFGDICHGGLYPADPVQKKEDRSEKLTSNRKKNMSSGIQNCIVHLTHSYRFGGSGGIGCLAQAINAGDDTGTVNCLEDEKIPEVTCFSPTRTNRLIDYLKQSASHLFGPYMAETVVERRLRFLNTFRILCAHKKGITGAETVNRIVGEIITKDQKLDVSNEWYAGRPVMVVQNDYQLNLFNGDVGIIGSSGGNPAVLSCYFLDVDGSLRSLAPARLPPHETVYAMTIHKSQGSEFDHVLIVLPDVPSPVVTRELLYTAVTRARKKVTILAKKEIIRIAVQTPIHRNSGLSEQLRR